MALINPAAVQNIPDPDNAQDGKAGEQEKVRNGVRDQQKQEPGQIQYSKNCVAEINRIHQGWDVIFLAYDFRNLKQSLLLKILREELPLEPARAELQNNRLFLARKIKRQPPPQAQRHGGENTVRGQHPGHGQQKKRR